MMDKIYWDMQIVIDGEFCIEKISLEELYQAFKERMMNEPIKDISMPVTIADLSALSDKD